MVFFCKTLCCLNLFEHFFYNYFADSKKYLIFAPAFCKECKTYCSIVSQSPREKRANNHYWVCSFKGADFPYLVVACGEP